MIAKVVTSIMWLWVRRTSLNDLFQKIRHILKENGHEYDLDPIYKEFRKGDVRHSLADISKAESMLGYSGYKSLNDGLKKQYHGIVKT